MMPTVNEKASNGVLDRFPDRIVDVVDFHDCSQGLGLKIFGGYSTTTAAEHGIYVKSVVPGGLAALAGRLQPGDQLLEVNGRALDNLTNARAVNMLRACAAQRILTLVLSRDRLAQKGYQKLCSSILSRSMMSLNVSDDIPRTKSRGEERRSGGGGERRVDSPLNTYRKRSSRRQDRKENRYTGVSALNHADSEDRASPHLKLVTKPRTVHIDYRTGLGMSICGGTNKAEGPGIFIDSIIPGGDVQRQGIMKPGDELVSVNGHVLEGLTHERAMKILTRLKLRQVKQVEIQYKAGNGVSPRLKMNSRAITAESNGVDKLLSHLAPAKATTSPAKATTSPHKTGTAPKKSASEGFLKVTQHTLDRPASDTLGGTSATRSITDTASSFLNTQLDQDSAPLRTGSLSPSQQISMDKLVVALQYLGYSPSQSQLVTLKQKLVIGSNNKVRYADFVAAAREVFAYKLNSEELGTEKTLKSLSDSMDDISRSRAELNKSINTLTDYKRRTKRSDLSSSVPDLSSHELRGSAAASNLHLHVTNNKRYSRASSPRSEGVISPVSSYQQSNSGWSLPQYDKDYSSSDPAELIRECAILAAELRKSEKIIMQYRGVTDKLLSFASNVQDSFKAEVSRSRSLERGTPLDRSRTRQSLATVVHGASKMISETQELMYQPNLPQGWEEAFTEDGARYYINHVTQTTSWDKPIG